MANETAFFGTPSPSTAIYQALLFALQQLPVEKKPSSVLFWVWATLCTLLATIVFFLLALLWGTAATNYVGVRKILCFACAHYSWLCLLPYLFLTKNSYRRIPGPAAAATASSSATTAASSATIAASSATATATSATATAASAATAACSFGPPIVAQSSGTPSIAQQSGAGDGGSLRKSVSASSYSRPTGSSVTSSVQRDQRMEEGRN
ncbi:hypothetical protein ASPZODRAFT_143465 [Penicilliopsis zonata CBS 506.65]|uniref:Uncharacterized protein n=1 Tax=Penicilliopsis zonata CBS 506.65 TaxID=1073090 RepID=A0A1L9SEP0_9EURO|nr:hypothetical protein ASPZODRAFT_143465 [Penicilliopsis zonata CBS 506.65]OJJ45573.1 hypothetical protein ASPZODRAFT_143465 [Penicilliopsis zonata CBS 506.65]